MSNIAGQTNRIKKLQSSLARFTIAKQLFSQAWPEVLGNRPEYFDLLQRIQVDLDQAMEIAMRQIQEVEYELSQENN